MHVWDTKEQSVRNKKLLSALKIFLKMSVRFEFDWERANKNEPKETFSIVLKRTSNKFRIVQWRLLKSTKNFCLNISLHVKTWEFYFIIFVPDSFQGWAGFFHDSERVQIFFHNS